jgi:hypothetical protein
MTDKLIEEYKNSNLDYEEEGDYLIFHNNFDLWKGQVNNDSYEERRGKLYIPRQAFRFSVFWDKANYYNKVHKNEVKNNDLVILNYNKQYDSFIFKASQDKAFLNSEEIKNYLVPNTRVYFDAIKFLAEREISEKNENDFIDFHSVSSRKIVLSSLSDKKQVKFLYRASGIPASVREDIDYRASYEDFKHSFDEGRKHLPLFIKRAIIKHVNQSNTEESLVEFLNKLSTILNEAKINFDAYYYDLSVDQIKEDYKEYKEKYLEEQSQILSKISNQVFALPISIAVVLYAILRIESSDKIQNDPLVLIAGGVLAYLVFVSYSVKIFYTDLKELRGKIEEDFEKLKENKFFENNPDELEKFGSEKDWMDKRTVSVKNGLKLYYWLLWVVNTILIFFSLKLYFDLPSFLNYFYLSGFGAYLLLSVVVSAHFIFNGSYKK